MTIGAPIPVGGTSEALARSSEGAVRELVERARALHDKVRA